MAYTIRRPHVLTAPQGQSLPSQVVVIATERCQEKIGIGQTTIRQTAVAVCASFSRMRRGESLGWQSEYFSPATNFWTWLYNHCYRGTSTLLVGFDVYQQLTSLGLWEEFEAGRLSRRPDPRQGAETVPGEVGLPPSGTVICENPPTVIVCFVCGKKATLRIVDIRNYGCESVLDLENQALECDRDWFCDTFDAGRVGAELSRQCLGVQHWLESHLRILHTKGLGSFQHTMASQSSHAFRKRYMSDAIYIHCDEEALSVERASLYGGRAEVGFLGSVESRDTLFELDYDVQPVPGNWYVQGKVCHLDVNSMYPSVMQMHQFPCKLLGSVCNPTKDWVAERMRTHLLIGEVVVETVEPCVPYRADGLVIYPTGRFTTTLCQPEIELALECGASLTWRQAWFYKPAYLFGAMIADLYGLRLELMEEGQVAQADCLKLLLNSLAGKFAQRSKRWVVQPDEAADSDWCFWRQVEEGSHLPVNWRCLAGIVEKEVIEGEHPESFPAVTAFVNSYARSKLYRVIRQLPPRSVFYYDTDSIHTSDCGMEFFVLNHLCDQARLGQWKLVGQYDRVRYYGVKKYQADDKIVWAGLPANAKFERGVAEWLEAEKLDKSLARNQGPPEAICQTRKLSQGTMYRHGWRDSQGWIHPFVEIGD